MATVNQIIGEHDVVELRDSAGRWRAGTRGTVVSDYGKVKLVEIADERGVALDFLQVSEVELSLLTRHGH